MAWEGLLVASCGPKNLSPQEIMAVARCARCRRPDRSLANHAAAESQRTASAKRHLITLPVRLP